MRMSNWISDVCASDLRETGADGDVRRYSELPFDDLPAGLTDRILRSRPDRTNEPIVVVRSEPGADTEQRRYERSLEHMAPMILGAIRQPRSDEHTSELQSLMRISYAVFCFKKKKIKNNMTQYIIIITHNCINQTIT